MPNPSTPSPSSTQAYSDPSQTRWAWLHPYRWWLLAIMVTATIAGILTLLLVTKTITVPNLNPTPIPTTAVPTPTPDAAIQAYFAQLSPSMLYYSFAQTSSGKIVYQTDTTDTKRRSINIGYPGTYSFIPSPDGRWLARYNDHQIELASSATPTTFSPIYTFNDTQLRLTSAIWQANSQALAIVLSKTNPNPPDLGHSLTNQIIMLTIANDGHAQDKQILRADTAFRYKLVGLPGNQKLWYVEDRNGVVSNLTKMNLPTTVTDYVFTAFNQNNIVTRMQFTADMTFGYIISEASVVQYNLSNQQTKIIHQLDISCPNSKIANESHITSLSVNPYQPQLLLAVDHRRCPGAPTPKNGTTQATQQLLIVDTQTNQIIQKHDGQVAVVFNQAVWSPDSHHIWVTVDATTNFSIDVNPWNIRPIPNQDRTTINKEKVYFLGWLSSHQQDKTTDTPVQ